ncbi:Hypothetical protein PENO1_057130 [Penicillium occitanis (nom. inval.)]|nr:Hypothetical protein PENO1_057130 [Penicillium occitanis (nom. inval.)]PCG99354.1 hypothetical protein PENOC_058460 [Penicillium occitanis (nom. inval.)]
MFGSIAIILTCIFINGLVASPLSVRYSSEELIPNDYLELWNEDAKFSDGKLTYYGPSNSTLKAARAVHPEIEGRSGCSTTATPSCHDSHSARNDVCDQLVAELQGDYQVPIPQAPRQICYEGSSESNAHCCVSWHNPVPGLIKGDLYDYAYSIMITCTEDGISGKINGVKVHNTCTNVCLSNRGTGC